MCQNPTDDEIKHLQRLLDTHTKRLRILEEQRAQFGAFVPAFIVFEIDEIQQKIAEITARLGALGGESSAPVEATPAQVTPAAATNQASQADAGSPAAAATPAPQEPQSQQQAYATAMRQILITYFNLSELRTLCFDLQIDYEDLAGPTKGEKALELVTHMQRHGRSAELERKCRELRPHADWRVLDQARHVE